MRTIFIKTALYKKRFWAWKIYAKKFFWGWRFGGGGFVFFGLFHGQRVKITAALRSGGFENRYFERKKRLGSPRGRFN